MINKESMICLYVVNKLKKKIYSVKKRERKKDLPFTCSSMIPVNDKGTCIAFQQKGEKTIVFHTTPFFLYLLAYPIKIYYVDADDLPFFFFGGENLSRNQDSILNTLIYIYL